MKGKAIVDGRGNCIDGSCAAILYAEGSEIARKGLFLGEVTNNVAEYEAVILGLRMAQKTMITKLDIISDSKLIVNQIRGVFQIKNPAFLPLRKLVWDLGSSFERVDIWWMSRENTHAADQICRDISSGK
jgi:ribonuclease HI